MGFLAGIVTMTSINPLEVLSTKLQVGTARGPLSLLRLVVSKDTSTNLELLAFKSRRRLDCPGEDGLAGLFKGYWFNLILCSNAAIQNTVFVQRLGKLSAKICLESTLVVMQFA